MKKIDCFDISLLFLGFSLLTHFNFGTEATWQASQCQYLFISELDEDQSWSKHVAEPKLQQ